MNYKNYIWDLGGTLLNNYESSSLAFATALWEQAERVALHAEVYAALKVSTAHAIEHFAADLPDFLAEYKRLEAVTLERPILFDGAAEVLQAIVANGGQNFMISHRNSQVLDILKKADISQYFTEVITSDQGFPRKPAPDSIRYLLEKYELDAEETVMIGDRPLDIEAGQAAGVKTAFFDADQDFPAADENIKQLKDLL